MPRKQMNIGLTVEQRTQVDAAAAVGGDDANCVCPCCYLGSRPAAPRADGRGTWSKCRYAAEAEGLSLTAFCRYGHPRSGCAGGTWSRYRCRWHVGFLAWLMAVLSAARRGSPTRA